MNISSPARRFIEWIESPGSVVVILAVAAIARIAWIVFIAVIGVQPASDGAWYYDRAVDIASGAGYAIDGVPTAYWPIGYPGFLGLLFQLVGTTYWAIYLSNLLLLLFSIYLSGLIALHLFKSRTVACLTMLILALYPNQIAYTTLPLSEPLFLCLEMSLILLLLTARQSRWRLIGAGVLCGLAVLVKPQALPLPAIVLLADAWQQRKTERWRGRSLTTLLLNGTIIYGIIAAIILPWGLRNRELFGSFLLSNNEGVNLLIGNNPYANGTYRLDPTIAPKDWKLQGEYDQNASARALAMQYLREHPVQAATRIPLKFWHLYKSDVEGVMLNRQGYAGQGTIPDIALTAFSIWAQIYYMAMMLGMAFLLIRYRGAKSGRLSLPPLGLWIILYFTAVSLVYFGNPRFHFAVMPWVAMYLAALVGWFVKPSDSQHGR